MKKSSTHLKLIVDNDVVAPDICPHQRIVTKAMIIVENTINVSSYQCMDCRKKFMPTEVGIYQDSLGYVDYYAIGD